MERPGQQLIKDRRVDGGSVGGDLDRSGGADQRGVEEPPGRSGITPVGQHHVDDLAELVNRPIQVPPDTGNSDVCFVDVPGVAGIVAARSGGVDQPRCEPLHPAIQSDVIDLDAPLGQQLLQIPVRQAVAQVPAHRQQDHLAREPEPGETRGQQLDWMASATAAHRTSLPLVAVNATEPPRLLRRAALGDT